MHRKGYPRKNSSTTLDNISVDGRFRLYKIKQAAAYPELWNDWIEFCRIRFAENYKACSDRLRQRYCDPEPLFLDARLERRYRRAHYETIDPELLCPAMDLFGHHMPGGSAYDYGGRPAEPDRVLESMILKTLYQDYSRNICAKPIVNPECIVGGVSAVSVDIDAMVAKSMAPLQAEWQRASKRPSPDGWHRFEFTAGRHYTTVRDMDHLSFFLTGGGFDGPVRLRLNGETVHESSKPDLRYPWESFAGLCHRFDLLPEFAPYMRHYSGLLFNRIATDVLSCRQIIAGKHRQYDLLVVPYAEMVRKGTFEAIHSYVAGGGTLLLTHKSLVKDDHFYEKLPVERLIGQPASETVTTRRIGSGTVYYVPKDLAFNETHRLIGDILEKQRIGKDLDIAFQQNEEFPFVEAQIIGTPDRFLVYLMNWGGMPQRGRLRILPRFLGQANGTRYRVRHLQQRRQVGAELVSAAALTAGVEVEIPVQTATVYVFESEQRVPLRFVKPAEERMRVLREIKGWKRRRPVNRRRPAVLVLCEPFRNGIHEMGIWTSPVLIDLLQKAGCDVHERSRAELREEGLAHFDVLFIQEDYKHMWGILMRDKAFVASIREFVAGGGGLFVCGVPDAYANNVSAALNTLLRPEQVRTKGGWFSDPGSCVNGDPLQVVFSDVRPHPVTKGVKRLATLFAAPLRDPKSALTPLIFSRKADWNAPGQPVLLAGNLGKGRVVASGDNYFVQPFRIEEADNLRLTWNIFTWLSGNRIPDVPTAELRKRLMFTEEQVHAWEDAEGF
ncbi:MAG: beta-galactosidase trimerization domain-containing protein [Kiritimatiellae bacterium]|nr:beta-galactosidase trimerization domain-containing protein [Kiritimatiellia bacterium]